MIDITEVKAREIEKFTKACTLFLDRLCIGDLRSYGRDLGVARPTVMKKEELTAAIIGILTGKLLPIEVSNQGAPVKNDYVDTRIPEKMQALRQSFMPTLLSQLEMRYRMERAQENKPIFYLRSPSAEEVEKNSYEKPSTNWEINPYEIYRGQVVFVHGDYYVYPLNGIGERVVFLPLELFKMKKLREGDVLSFRAFKNRALGACVTEILTVNSYFSAIPTHRPNFDESVSFCSTEPLRAYKTKKFTSTISKYIDWLQPVCMGQRAIVSAPPKSGKSTLLCEAASSIGGLNENVTTFALLINQPMDVVYAYAKKIPKENLFYTVCGEDPYQHLFMANFALNRAKRMAEGGENVFLAVDSLSELARVYNDVEESAGELLPCGLEQKTLAYVREFFSAAKYLLRGGSLTVLAAIDKDTGDPVDDLLKKELCALANYQISLTDRLVRERIYPAIDYAKSNADKLDKVRSKGEQALDTLIRRELLAKIGDEGIIAALQAAASKRDFVKAMEEAYER